MKLIIAGSQNFTDDAYFRHEMNKICREHDIAEIICGTEHRGIHWCAKSWAVQEDVLIKEFPRETDKYGRRAIFVRNEQMADYGTDLFVLWDGRQTRAVRHMINTALNIGLSVSIHNFNLLVPSVELERVEGYYIREILDWGSTEFQSSALSLEQRFEIITSLGINVLTQVLSASFISNNKPYDADKVAQITYMAICHKLGIPFDQAPGLRPDALENPDLLAPIIESPILLRALKNKVV